MILIFPMLVSQAVSENSVPAIAKTLEIYIVGNEMSNILADPRSSLRKYGYRISGGRIVKENTQIEEQGGPPGSAGGSGKKGPSDKEIEELRKKVEEAQKEAEKLQDELEELKKSKADERRIFRAKQATEKAKIILQKNRQKFEEAKWAQQQAEKEAERKEEEAKWAQQQAEKEAERKEKEEEKEAERKAKAAKVKVSVGDYKSVSVEPTYLSVDIGDSGIEQRIGIKVLPLRVKSDAKLSHLMLYDYKMKPLLAMATIIGRKAMKLVYRFVNTWRRRLGISLPSPSGDPRRDILMSRSGFEEPFVVLSRTEDFDEFFLSNYSKVARLSKMGWGNFIIADDVNRQAYFCMKEFRGVCNVVSYPMMYNNLGQLKVYETLEDAKKKSSSLFKISKRFSRVIGEWVAHNKLEKYLFLRED